MKTSTYDSKELAGSVFRAGTADEELTDLFSGGIVDGCLEPWAAAIFKASPTERT